MSHREKNEDQISVAPKRVTELIARQDSESLLRASQEFNRSLMDATPDCIMVLDLDGRLLQMNTPGLHAMEIDDFIAVSGQEWGTSWPAEAKDDIARSVARAASGEFSRFQAYCPTAKGTLKWWEVAVSPVRDEPGGQVVRILAVSRDVTEMKKGETGRDLLLQQLEAERGRLAAVFRQAPAFMCVVREPDHKFEMANDRYCQLVGHRDVLGRSVRAALPEFEAQGFIKVLDAVYQTGEPFIGSGIPVLLAQQSGQPPEQRYIDVIYQALRDATGTITGIVTVGVDVTDRKQTADALRDSQQFTRNVLNNLFAFVGVLTPDGTLIDANRAPLEAAGISASDVRGKKFWDCYWWSYSLEVQTQLQSWCEQASRGEIIRCDVQVRLAGNTRVWIDFQLAPLRDAEGKITHLIPSGLDISGRREAERTLRASEERYRTLFDSMDEGYCVIEVLFDEAGQANDYRFLEVNPAFEKQTGMTGVTGQTMRTLVPDIETRWFDIYGQIVQTGEPVRFVDEAKVISRWFDVYAFRLGEFPSTKVAILFNDISARIRGEKALRDSEERFRNLADNIPQMAWIVDPGSEGKASWFNKVWLDYTGTTIAQMQGSGWKSVHHPDHLARVAQKFEFHVKNCLDWEDTFPLRGKNGHYRWFLSRMNCIRDASGTVVQIFGTNTDVTRERRLEQDLRQLAAELSEASNKKDEFLAVLAHELRNPLAPIRNGLQLMKRASGQKELLEQARAMMERQLTQLVRLIDDLMDVSRIRLGKLELRKERLPLAVVLSSAVETSRPLIEQMGHALSFTPPDSSVLVDADMTRLAQVFLNLLNNAAKYSKRGGRIQVRVELQKREVLVAVTDTGIGIAADQLPYIFDIFTQVDGSLEKSQGGLGIGLTLVQRLVEMHGGGVEAKSDGPGKGSTFIVNLPLVIEALQPEALSSDEKPIATAPLLRILIVDDNRDGADSLSELLNLMGNDTRTAYDGQEGVDMAEVYRPDVIVFDIGMPKLNGYEACSLIRKQPWSKDVVLIAITGWGQDKDRIRTREAGFDHHLVKPVDAEALMTILAGLHQHCR